jgi:hypothetical protein
MRVLVLPRSSMCGHRPKTALLAAQGVSKHSGRQLKGLQLLPLCVPLPPIVLSATSPRLYLLGNPQLLTYQPNPHQAAGDHAGPDPSAVLLAGRV